MVQAPQGGRPAPVPAKPTAMSFEPWAKRHEALAIKNWLILVYLVIDSLIIQSTNHSITNLYCINYLLFLVTTWYQIVQSGTPIALPWLFSATREA